jgi:ketosteroid isomerase-like protein
MTGDNNANVTARLDVLESKDAIRELTAAYCFAVAEGRGADIVDMFTTDGSFKMRGHEWTGTARLEEMYGNIADSVTPKPYIQNHVIEVAGDDATGRCGVEIRMVHKGEAYTVAGHYYDTYRRVGGRWRFAERDFHTFHWVPLSKGWA